jgi:hypothetical protein
LATHTPIFVVVAVDAISSGLLMASRLGTLGSLILIAYAKELPTVFVARMIDGLTPGNVAAAVDQCAPARKQVIGIASAAMGCKKIRTHHQHATETSHSRAAQHQRTKRRRPQEQGAYGIRWTTSKAGGMLATVVAPRRIRSVDGQCSSAVFWQLSCV